MKALASSIMEIHKWEWEEPADVQPREAVRVFEEMLVGVGKGAGAGAGAGVGGGEV